MGMTNASFNHAHERAFLYKELPRWDGRPNKDGAIHPQQLGDGVQSDAEV